MTWYDSMAGGETTPPFCLPQYFSYLEFSIVNSRFVTSNPVEGDRFLWAIEILRMTSFKRERKMRGPCCST